MNYIYKDGELYHFGVKGMRWGVRRYQNADGSLTPAGQKRYAKQLKKEFKKGYDAAHPFNTSEKYKSKLGDLVRKHISNDDKERIVKAKRAFNDTTKASIEAEDEIDKLARKYGKEFYDMEMKRAGDAYDTPKARDRLMEYCIFEDGYAKAEKSRPDLLRTIETRDKAYKSYMDECKKVSDKILGSYGDTKLTESKYWSLSIKDTVGGIVSSMDHNDWKIDK